MSYRERAQALVERVFKHFADPADLEIGGVTLSDRLSVRRSEDVSGLEDVFSGPVRQDAIEIALLRAEVADRPGKGDLISRDDGVFLVIEPARSRDSFGFFWHCVVTEQ